MVRVLLSGSSGFLGSRLHAALAERGHHVTTLVRREPTGPDESSWDPATGTLDAGVVEQADVVVNLAGSPTLGNPHSRAWSDALLESRVSTTTVLAEAVAAADSRPALLAGNAVGWYGDHGAQPVGEAADSRGHTLMTQVCRAWQEAATAAVRAGARVAFLRTSPVMDLRSAPLKMLVPLFRAGLGARLGDGRQHMPMVSLRDWVGGVVHVLEGDLEGPVNLTCPQTPTNAEFTATLARLLHRKALLPAPAPLLRLAAGRLSPELLGSVDAVPEALLGDGYAFRDEDVAAVLTAGLDARWHTLS
ncbi:TIGR01777 family oxidoreductase [Nocardioides sp.]|uniref:TIGR01777 family oxidoreductase n=1 Tax=Nocardioides sp. TaxID=35761 RepID=UPI0039E54BFC